MVAGVKLLWIEGAVDIMKTFFEYLDRTDDYLWLSETTIVGTDGGKPKHSEWSRNDLFYFDVEGDDCSPKWCYLVWFEELKSNSYEVEFKRGSNNSKDERRGVGIKVIGAVFYAIGEFIKKNNPDYLIWSPSKTKTANPVTGIITNPEGRRDAYDIFAIKCLFPSYVSVKINQWMRRDIYEREYVPKGYPSIPENLTMESSPLEKKKFLQNIRAV
jgi:hypothetical protein